jgi:hypothetical protein
MPACLQTRKHARRPASVLLAALCAFVLAGCATTDSGPGPRAAIHLPDQALLAAQQEPDCELKTQAHPSQADPGAERAKLDYERQCYRHAELIVRGRLRVLQAEVGETIKSVRTSGRSSAH